MKDAHLISAMLRAVQRYGSTALPSDGALHRSDGPRRHVRISGASLRSPGWVSIGEIEACQSPNTYPRLSRREIRTRCEALAREGSSPVRAVRKGSAGFRTWVLVETPTLSPAQSMPEEGDAPATGAVTGAPEAGGDGEGDGAPHQG